MTSYESLAGHVAVVTGATRGIGRALALSLARKGCDLVVVGRTDRGATHSPLPGSLEDTVAELESYGVSALAVRADLRSEADTQEIIDQTLDRFGRCDMLVNNAAYTSNGPITDVPWHRWASAFRVQVVAPMQMCQGFLPGMIERGRGVIMNVSSGASVRPVPGLALYSSSKLAMERWSECLHSELVGTGVDVNVLRVDRVVATEGWYHVVETQGIDMATGGSPDAVAVTTDSVAEAACWVLSRGQGWSGNVIGFADIAERGGPPVIDVNYQPERS